MDFHSQLFVYCCQMSSLYKKKEQSAGCGIGGCLANQNTNQSLIELSCHVMSPRPSVLKSDPVWLKRGQMGHHNQLSAFGSVCLFAKPNGDYHSLWSMKKNRYLQKKQGEYKWKEMCRLLFQGAERLNARHAENHKPAKQISSVCRSNQLSWSAIIMSASRAITFQK